MRIFLPQNHSLHAALKSALELYEQRMSEPFPADVRMTVTTDSAFWALAEPDNTGVHIHVSSGVVDSVSSMWHQAIAHSDTLPEEDRLNIGDVNQAIETSLMWLMLHELHHFQMGHFTINGGACLVENARAHSFALTSRSRSKPTFIDSLSLDEQSRVHMCLELQADHDSTEILLDAYSTDGWEILRYYAACIFVVMVLIDREDRVNIEFPKTHPKAATRIFQFLGYLSTMWSIPALTKAKRNGWDKARDEDIPTKQEIEVYHQYVVAPSIRDAILIARANDAPQVIKEIGSSDNFISDVRLVQTNAQSDHDAFNSVGAQEYNSLAALNITLLDYLSLSDFSS